MNHLKLLLLIGVFGILYACSDEFESSEETIEDITIESRKSCEGCTLTLSQNGCEIRYTTSEACGEIDSVTWIYPGSQSSNYNGNITASTIGGQYCLTIEFDSCGTLTECIDIDPDCDTRCEGCNASIVQEDCTLSAFGAACSEPLTYNWDLILPNGERGTSDDQHIEISVGGTYCVTITDGQGCRTWDCIDVETCECNPEWENTYSNPHILLKCFPNWEVPLLRNYWSFVYDCNDCCAEIEDKELSYTASSKTVNLNTGEVLLDKNKTRTRSKCYNNEIKFTSQALECGDVSQGDVLEMTWSVEILETIGCEFASGNLFTGTETYVVKSSDISCCE